MIHVRPKKSLGQHFLKDQNIARKIVGELDKCSSKTVLEIGPGTGVLTTILLNNPEINLYAVEVDKESYEYLLIQHPQLEGKLMLKDFLKMDIKENFIQSFTVIGNFPYNISSQIFFRILENRDLIPDVVCMIQKEVAERISASHGNKTYGILSVFLQAFYDIDYLFTVGPKVFDPPPKVNSAVIHLKRNTRKSLTCSEELFFKTVKLGFNQRRKTLRNSLKSILVNLQTDDEIFNKRPEQLSVDEFVYLTNLIDQKKQQ